MSVNLIRVVNQQLIGRSILIDKIDRSQGNFSGYAQRAKQKVYVPYANPLDSAVKGYVDLIPTDEVLLSADSGTIKGLKDEGYVDFAVVSSSLLAAPVATEATNGEGATLITGTTFVSVSPDVTYVYLTNLAGATQKIPQSAFSSQSGTEIVIADGTVTIGTPTDGWKVRVQANSKLSDEVTIAAV